MVKMNGCAAIDSARPFRFLVDKAAVAADFHLRKWRLLTWETENSKHSKCSYTCENRRGTTGISLQNSKQQFRRNWLRTGSAEHLLLPFHKRIQKTNNTVFPWSISARIFIVGLFNLASVTIANPSFFLTDIFSFSHGRPHTLYSSKSSSVTFYVTNNFIDILAAFWCTSIPNICLSKANSVLPCSWNNKCSLIFRQ